MPAQVAVCRRAGDQEAPGDEAGVGGSAIAEQRGANGGACAIGTQQDIAFDLPAIGEAGPRMGVVRLQGPELCAHDQRCLPERQEAVQQHRMEIGTGKTANLIEVWGRRRSAQLRAAVPVEYHGGLGSFGSRVEGGLHAQPAQAGLCAWRDCQARTDRAERGCALAQGHLPALLRATDGCGKAGQSGADHDHVAHDRSFIDRGRGFYPADGDGHQVERRRRPCLLPAASG